MFEFASPDARFGGWVRYTTHPHQDRASYQAFLAGTGRQLVAVLDDDVPLPATGLEIRTTGLWATHICETPFDHWTVGLEAFGVGVDDPGEIYGRQYGDQVPLGFDLEWEALGEDIGSPAYPQRCRVTGEVLVGGEELDVDLLGFRDHTWGPNRNWDARWMAARGALVDGTSFDVSVVGGDVAAARAVVDGSPVEVIEAVQSMSRPGIPDGARVRLDGVELALDALAVTPLALSDPEQRLTRCPRALCRVTADDDRPGWAWLTCNEPQAVLPT